MNISIPRVELRSAQTRSHQTELTSYLCVHYPGLSGVRGVARRREDLQIPDVVTGVWWCWGVTRMSSPRPRVKCTHVQWAPGETRRGQNVKYSPGILSKSPQPNTCHSWFLIKHHVLTRILNTGMYPVIMTLRRVSGASQDHNFYPLMTGRVSDGVWFLWL